MKGFFTVFLKIILVASFVAIIAFIVLVLVNNVNVAYNSYNYIAEAQTTAPYEHFAINVDRFVRRCSTNDPDTATLVRDEKAEFLTNTTDTLNETINYYVDYLSVQGELSKGEQVELTKSYKAYQDAFSEAISVYNDYMELLKANTNAFIGPSINAGTPIWAENGYAMEMFSAQERALVLSYCNAYQKGSVFFRDLLRNVKAHALTSRLTFNETLLCLKVYFADRALVDIFANGQSTISSTAVQDYSKVLHYEEGADALSDANLLTNNSLRVFIDEASTLDLYSLVNNNLGYLDTLASEDRAKAMRTYNFIENNILA